MAPFSVTIVIDEPGCPMQKKLVGVYTMAGMLLNFTLSTIRASCSFNEFPSDFFIFMSNGKW